MQRLKYREISAGWGLGHIVAGYEVALPSGARGVGETLDEALRAAQFAESTHAARVERMEREAMRRRGDRDAELRAANGGERPDATTEMPF